MAFDDKKWLKAIQARGGCTSKPGTWLLEQLRDWLSRQADAKIYEKVQSSVRKGPRYAQTALDHLAAGNAEWAIVYTFLAHQCAGQFDRDAEDMEHSNDLQTLSARWERDTQTLSARWERDTQPAVEREVNRIEGKRKQREKTEQKAEEAIESALGLMKTPSGERGMTKTAAQKKAAKQHGIGLTTLRELWKKRGLP
jgi:O-methyltransferase involved in polyketide biosynthesis